MSSHARSTASQPERTHDRPRWMALFDLTAVVAFAVAWLGLAHALIAGADALVLLLALAVALPLGYLVADAVSGLVHWFADSFFDERTPVLGPLLIEPFREHHRDALAITHHGFLEVCGNNCAVCVPPLLAAWWLLPSEAGAVGSFAVAGLLSLSFFVFATNGFHRWAHMSEPPGWVAWLQQQHLILSPEQHALHHEGGHDCAYCVTSGWLNPLLDSARLFERATKLGARWLPSRRPVDHGPTSRPGR